MSYTYINMGTKRETPTTPSSLYLLLRLLLPQQQQQQQLLVQLQLLPLVRNE